MTKILPDDFKMPENPCEGCDADCEDHNAHLDADDDYRSTCPAVIAYMAQQSILSACVEVDLYALKNAYDDYIDNGHYAISKTFKEFVQQFLKEQESRKDG